MVTIPASLIIAFLFMYLLDWTINIMSLSALAVAIGMVVDNAVVVLENIVSHMSRGVKRREAPCSARTRWDSVVASTLTTIVVFLPLIYEKGVSGIMMKQLLKPDHDHVAGVALLLALPDADVASVLLRSPEKLVRSKFNNAFQAW